MRRVSTILLVAALVATFACKTAPQWTQYTSAEGRYSVLFPGQPQLRTQEETTGDGGKIQQYLAVASDSSGAAYLVAYFDLGDRTFSFDQGRDGALARVKGTLISERNIDLKGYPGREVTLSAKTASNLELRDVVRFYQVDKRIFIAQYLAPKSAGQDLPEKASKFFDSLQVRTN